MEEKHLHTERVFNLNYIFKKENPRWGSYINDKQKNNLASNAKIRGNYLAFNSYRFLNNNILKEEYLLDELLGGLTDSVTNLNNRVSGFVNLFQTFQKESLVHLLSGSKYIIDKDIERIKKVYASTSENIDSFYLDDELLFYFLDIDTYDEIYWYRLNHIKDAIYGVFKEIYNEFEKIRRFFLKPFLIKNIFRDVRRGFRRMMGFIIKNLDDESHLVGGIVSQSLTMPIFNTPLNHNEFRTANTNTRKIIRRGKILST
ncbi:MAG: hypothetical protein WD604_08180 [Balneolaceae bacterium]